jgi:hypothetical protein
LSPEAKGRVERMWGTLQVRLVSELRLAGAATQEESPRVLDACIPECNKKWSCPDLMDRFVTQLLPRCAFLLHTPLG